MISDQQGFGSILPFCLSKLEKGGSPLASPLPQVLLYWVMCGCMRAHYQNVCNVRAGVAQFCLFFSQRGKGGWVSSFSPKAPLYPRFRRPPYILDSAGPTGQCSWMGRVDMMAAREGRINDSILAFFSQHMGLEIFSNFMAFSQYLSFNCPPPSV
jgi:hypothetical protein